MGQDNKESASLSKATKKALKTINKLARQMKRVRNPEEILKLGSTPSDRVVSGPGRLQRVYKDQHRDPADYCYICGKDAIKTDSKSRGVCRKHAVNAVEPIKNPVKRPGPNEPCRCGSGKKFKKCCFLLMR